MPKTLIVRSSNTGATKDMGDFIAEQLRSFSIETDVRNAEEVKSETDLAGYDALVFGSATYHMDDLERLRSLMVIAGKMDLKGKIGGAFGSADWYGDTPDTILFETMDKTFGMNMLNGPLKLTYDSFGDDDYLVQNFALEIVNKLTCN